VGEAGQKLAHLENKLLLVGLAHEAALPLPELPLRRRAPLLHLRVVGEAFFQHPDEGRQRKDRVVVRQFQHVLALQPVVEGAGEHNQNGLVPGG
jgi:hypothetical protein